MTQYERGTRLERTVHKRLTERGFYVGRMAGSHGIADLIAFDVRRVRTSDRRWNPWLINVKMDRHHVSRDEWNALLTLANVSGMGAYIADRSGPRRIPQMWRVNGPRDHHERIDPLLQAVPWELLPIVPVSARLIEPTWSDLSDAGLGSIVDSGIVLDTD